MLVYSRTRCNVGIYEMSDDAIIIMYAIQMIFDFWKRGRATIGFMSEWKDVVDRNLPEWASGRDSGILTWNMTKNEDLRWARVWEADTAQQRSCGEQAKGE